MGSAIAALPLPSASGDLPGPDSTPHWTHLHLRVVFEMHWHFMANQAGVSGTLVKIGLPFGDFLNTIPLSVPWLSSTKGASLTPGIIDSFAAMFQDTSEG